MIIDLGLTSLSQDELERLSIILERNARKTILDQVPINQITDLNFSIELDMKDTLSIDFEIELEIPDTPEEAIQTLIQEAFNKAFYAFEHELKKFQASSK